MSIKVMGLIWDSDLPYNEKFVAICLADWSNDEGESIYPSIEKIAWKTGYSERQVYDLLGLLKSRGVLSWDSHGSKYGTNQYTINFNHLPQREPYRPAKSAGDDLRNPQVKPAKSADNPLDIRQVNPLNTARENLKPEEETPEEYFERTYPQVEQVRPKRTSEQAKESIRAALEESLANSTGKDLSVENFLTRLPEGHRPLARAFCDKFGRAPLTRNEETRWRKDITLLYQLQFEPSDISDAFDAMTRSHMTIGAPSSLQSTAESRRRERTSLPIIPGRMLYNSAGEQIS